MSIKFQHLLEKIPHMWYYEIYNGGRKMDNEIMTIQQAAEYLQVCDKTVRRLISKKELSASKIGKSWRIKKSDIEEYLLQTRNM